MALVNLDGDLALEATLQSLLTELQTQQKDALTDAELRAADVVITLNGEQVTISNQITGFALETTLQSLLTELQNQQTDALTDAELRAADVPVTVSNQITGFATETTLGNLLTELQNQQTDALTDAELRATPVKVSPDEETGTWGYAAGVDGSPTLPANSKVLQITAMTLEAAATLTINGGDTITIPYSTANKTGSSVTITPKGNLVQPTLTFTDTASYFVEYVT